MTNVVFRSFWWWRGVVVVVVFLIFSKEIWLFPPFSNEKSQTVRGTRTHEPNKFKRYRRRHERRGTEIAENFHSCEMYMNVISSQYRTKYEILESIYNNARRLAIFVHVSVLKSDGPTTNAVCPLSVNFVNVTSAASPN